MNFAGKVALVTGASRGIGRAIAMELADCGARVLVHYHRDERSAAATLRSLAGEGHAMLQANVMEADEAQQLVEGTLAQLGKIDVLVNNAGIYRKHPASGVSFDEWRDAWRQTLEVNLIGPANVSFCAVRHMLEQGGGKIVNISSRGAFRGEPEAPAYGASKAGVNAMSQSMAKELASRNIFVYVVAPGFVETDMAAPLLRGSAGDAIRSQSPLNRVARPEEIARTVAFLASDGSEFLTGCIVDVNGASYLRS